MRKGVRNAALVFLVIAWLVVVGFLAVLAEGYVPRSLRQFLIAALVLGPLLIFGQALVEGLLQVVAYGVGRAILPIVSAGFLRAESFGDIGTFPWYGVAREPGGKYVLSADGTSVVGLVALAAIGVAAYFIFAT